MDDIDYSVGSPFASSPWIVGAQGVVVGGSGNQQFIQATQQQPNFSVTDTFTYVSM